MSIYFKSRTQKDFSKIDISGSYISAIDLKKQMITKLKLNTSKDFRFTLKNKEETHEYANDESVMKNSYVVYRIEPLDDGEIGILRAINQRDKRPNKREQPKQGVPTQAEVAGSSSVAAVTSAANSKPTLTTSSVGSVGSVGSSSEETGFAHDKNAIVPPDYLCQLCYVRGHFQEYCPHRDDDEWPAKMRKWNFKVSRGIPTERLRRINDPLSVETLIRQGKTMVLHPEFKHLCMVEEVRSTAESVAAKKVQIDIPQVFKCYTGDHVMDDAVILSCCCKVIGCRSHILDLIMKKDMTCPECGKKVIIANICSSPVLSESIDLFIKQREQILKITIPTVSSPTPAQDPISEEEHTNAEENMASAPTPTTIANPSSTKSSTAESSSTRDRSSSTKSSSRRSRSRSRRHSRSRSRSRSRSSRRHDSHRHLRDRSRSHRSHHSSHHSHRH